MSSTIKQLQELIGTQTEVLLTEVTPKVVDVVRAEVMADFERVIEQRVAERLAVMWPNAEKNAHAALFHALDPNGTAKSKPIAIPSQSMTPDMLYDLLTTLDPITASLGVTKTGKTWSCVFCGTRYDSQRAASSHSRKCTKRDEVLAKNAPKAPKAKKSAKKSAKPSTKKQRKNPKRECIKPGCETPSKGPRYHHLCEDHRSAPTRQVAAWQRKVREAPTE